VVRKKHHLVAAVLRHESSYLQNQRLIHVIILSGRKTTTLMIKGFLLCVYWTSVIPCHRRILLWMR
jgi:hypothetical protein